MALAHTLRHSTRMAATLVRHAAAPTTRMAMLPRAPTAWTRVMGARAYSFRDESLHAEADAPVPRAKLPKMRDPRTRKEKAAAMLVDNVFATRRGMLKKEALDASREADQGKLERFLEQIEEENKFSKDMVQPRKLLELKESLPPNTQIHNEVIEVTRVSHMTPGGRVYAYKAVVVVGTGNGAAGYASAQGGTAIEAVHNAQYHALKNMVVIDRWNRTLFQPLNVKAGATKLVIRPSPSGYKASNVIIKCCWAFGLKDVHCKIHGSRNNLNVVRAFFKAMVRHQSPQQIALKRGLRVYDMMSSLRVGPSASHSAGTELLDNELETFDI